MKAQFFPLAALTLTVFPLATLAAPYASAIVENGTDVSFTLNESADSVKIIFADPLPAVDLGPKPAGSHTFVRTPAATYRIQVEKDAGPGWKSGVLQQISNDTSDLVKFANGLGVAVNRKPGSGKYFGRVYVSCSQAGTAAPVTSPVSPGRATAEGIYVLNPDLSATALGNGALLGGLTFVNPATGVDGSSPYRLAVGDGGDLFITDWSDTNGSVYKTDGDVKVGKNVLGGPVGAPNPPLAEAALHGSIAAVVTEGSELAGNLRLWTIDEDLQADKTSAALSMIDSIWLWDSAGQPLPMQEAPAQFNTSTTNIGINFASQTADLARGPDGTFYKTQRRSAGNESAVFALDVDGNTLNNVPPPANPDDPVTEAIGSRSTFHAYAGETGLADPFLETRGCDISDDGWMALIRNDNAIHLVKVDAGLIDFNSHILLYPKPATTIGRDITFDAAGNLYTISSGQALLRVYSRGGHTRAITASDGTFQISEVTPTAPADPIDYKPVVTDITRAANGVTLSVLSRLGLVSTLTVQRSLDLDPEFPWETLPVAEYTITGDPPNFTVKIPAAIRSEKTYFYRVRRL